eukprot:352441-Chlamydomonas_euryale.AAC.4
MRPPLRPPVPLPHRKQPGVQVTSHQLTRLGVTLQELTRPSLSAPPPSKNAVRCATRLQCTCLARPRRWASRSPSPSWPGCVQTRWCPAVSRAVAWRVTAACATRSSRARRCRCGGVGVGGCSGVVWEDRGVNVEWVRGLGDHGRRYLGSWACAAADGCEGWGLRHVLPRAHGPVAAEAAVSKCEGVNCGGFEGALPGAT